jgi:hypothetical protein
MIAERPCGTRYGRIEEGLLDMLKIVSPYEAEYVAGREAEKRIPESYPYAAVVNPYTGRWCTFEPSGYHWCWTP